MGSMLHYEHQQTVAVSTSITRITSVLSWWLWLTMPINSLMWMWVITEATQIPVSSNILHLDLKFMAQHLQIPGRKMLPGFPQAGLLPHCIVGDEAFPLRPDLMKPFPRGQRGKNLPEDQLVFNYRLSHACRISENAFGILVQRWRVFDRWMYLSDKNAIKVIQAATVLHNYLTPAHFNVETMMVQLKSWSKRVWPPGRSTEKCQQSQG